MRLIFLAICIFWFGVTARAGQLDSLEQRMVELQKTLTEGNSDPIRQAASDSLRHTLIYTFTVEGSFTYPFDRVIGVAINTSPDNAFKLYNWSVAHTDGTYSYYAFVVFPDGDYTELLDRVALTRNIESAELKSDEWYGALYYEIFPVKTRKETYYTLMGWDGNDNLSNKKVLDVLNIDRKNRVTLGRPIYQAAQSEDTWLNRRVFEYAEQARINLRYLQPKAAIIFDRLEPENPALTGRYEYYIPSTAYNGYVLDKSGRWHLHEFFDMTRPKSEESGAQFNFPERVRFDKR